jgi:hypothetical protein
VSTTDVPGVPVEADAAPQVGAGAHGRRNRAGVSVTLPLKPLLGLTVTVEVAEPPGLTVARESAVALTA